MTKKRFAAIGECMLEFANSGGQQYQLGFAGDTFNVTVYLARCIQDAAWNINYITALGDDPFSDQMLESWNKEGIDTRLVRRVNQALPGLYIIHNDDQGERSFYFYRSEAAAKKMFSGVDGEKLLTTLGEFDFLYFSGIALAILDDATRAKLIATLAQARQNGKTICFDINYRPSLWKNAHEAKKWIDQAVSIADIALPSFDDEVLLYQDQSPEKTAERLRTKGVKEIVVKQGEKGYYLSTPDIKKQVSIKPAQSVLDTTAAGDSFNGAYIAARLQGVAVEAAAEQGAKLAAHVIGYKGAIIAKKDMPTW